MFDPIDHPFISITTIVLIVMGVLLGLVTLVYFLEGNNNPYNYKYIDVDGNEGYAHWCSWDATLSCYYDGGYIQVKEFHKND